MSLLCSLERHVHTATWAQVSFRSGRSGMGPSRGRYNVGDKWKPEPQRREQLWTNFTIQRLQFRFVRETLYVASNIFSGVLNTLKTTKSVSYKVFTRQQQSAFMLSRQSPTPHWNLQTVDVSHLERSISIFHFQESFHFCTSLPLSLLLLFFFPATSPPPILE